MSGAPYGYRYVRKTDEAPAAYAVLEAEARVVERIYEMYTVEGLSIGEITRPDQRPGIPTRKASARWERSRSGPCCATLRIAGLTCFREDPRLCTDARHPSAASARCGYAPVPPPATSARAKMDRDPRAGFSKRRELRPCPGTPAGE